MSRCLVAVWLLCAWVLWARVVTEPTADAGMITRAMLAVWTPHSAYATKAECQQTAKSEGVKYQILSEYREESLKGALFTRCLPDTVDPRGK